MSTAKQIDYATALLKTLGYAATGRINGCHVHLGAPTGEDRGTVSDWLASMSSGEISSLIDTLLDEGRVTAKST